MKAIILAGGFEKKMNGVVNDGTPLPMVLIAGKPLLEHQILHLRDQNIKDIIITVHHMKDFIKSYFGDGKRWKVDITYSEEDSPLGTAGAIKNAEKYIQDTFIVLNGDSYSQIDINKFLDYHKSKKSQFSVALSKSNDKERFGNVIFRENKIIDFIEKKEIRNDMDSLVNSGVYIFEPIIFDYIQYSKKVSLERDVFPRLAKENLLWGYEYEGYFIDIGKSKNYNQFKKDVLSSLFLGPEEKIRKAMRKITKSDIDLIFIVDENKKLLGVLNDKLIKVYLLSGGNIDDKVSSGMVSNLNKIARVGDSDEKKYELLKSTRHLPILDEEDRIVDVEFRSEKIKTENFPIVRGKAPLRISFAGGGTDLPSFFGKQGGVVINCTIDKYCYGTIVKRKRKNFKKNFR